MSNTAISQALVEIEKNLEKLSTARKQVVDVTQSGEELTSLIVELTGKVDKLFQSILKESDSYNNAFLKSHKSFEQKLNTLLEKSDKSISTFQEGIQNIEPEISQKITEIADSTLGKSERLATQQEEYFEKVKQNIDSYKNTLKEFSESVSEKSLDSKFNDIQTKLVQSENTINSVIKKQFLEIDELNKDIINRAERNHEKLHDLLKGQEKINTLLEEQIQLSKENKESLEHSIEDLVSNQMKRNYITWSLIILTILSVIFL
ncbi:hypothetical protein [Christiangramia echinicola]|uniref:Uncharacterized protein n=1 Tax=Christiangramia echinicola TaxID=279359 RepID=A0A1H1RMJ1_9FLAO|nr:hypothetical protein [Christiangramia echinicola]SDS36209.1 hypothetical protein SAMN04488552_2929 [Christiangramia echinicola]